MCKLIEGLQNIAKNEALNAMRLAYSMDEEGTACIDDIKIQVDIAKEMMEVYLACEKEIFDRWKSGSIEELLEKSGLQKEKIDDADIVRIADNVSDDECVW